MSYKGVLVNNLLYSRKYLLSYDILYGKKDNFFSKRSYYHLPKRGGITGDILVYPPTFYIKKYFIAFLRHKISEISED